MEDEKRLIVANALQDEIRKSKDRHRHLDPKIAENHHMEHDAFLELVDNAPTVDAVEVVHGRWEPYAIQPNGFVGSYRCAACGNASINDSNYCPNCGAKMDGGNEDG